MVFIVFDKVFRVFHKVFKFLIVSLRFLMSFKVFNHILWVYISNILASYDSKSYFKNDLGL